MGEKSDELGREVERLNAEVAGLTSLLAEYMDPADAVRVQSKRAMEMLEVWNAHGQHGGVGRGHGLASNEGCLAENQRDGAGLTVASDTPPAA